MQYTESKYYSVIFALLLGFLLLQESIYAQSITDARVKTALIYKFTDFISWDKEETFKRFEIAIYGEDSLMNDEFHRLSRVKKIKGKPLYINSYKEVSDIAFPQILYIPSSYNGDIEKIYAKVLHNNVLLISEECKQQKLVMINFLSGQRKNGKSVQFELNKRNIVEQNLAVMPKLLLLGGTEIDVRELYKAQERELIVEREKGEQREKEIQRQKEEIRAQNLKIDEQKKEIGFLQSGIEEKQRVLIELSNNVEVQQKALIAKLRTLHQQEQEIRSQKNAIEEQKKLITQQQEDVNNHNLILQDQTDSIKKQQNKINEQRQTLSQQLSQIESQKLILYLFFIFIILVLFLAFFIYRSYRIKQIANRKLEDKNIAISSQKEELAAQAEVLEFINKELEKLSIVARETDNAVIITDSNGNFEWVNEGFTRMYGHTLEELMRNKGKGIIENSNHPDIKEFINVCKVKKKTVIYESYTISKTGQTIWAQTTLTPILDNNENVIKIVAIDSDITKLKDAEQEIIQQSEEIRQQSEELMVQAERLQETNYELALQKNKAEKAYEDLKKTQAQLIHSEKMASLGQLTAGIAHEINNPVNYVNAGADALKTILKDLFGIINKYDQITPENVFDKLKEIDYLKKEYEYDELVKGLDELTRSIKVGAERTTEIVRSLRTFSRLDEDALKFADIHENIDSTLVMLRNQYKSRIEIVRQFSDIPKIECYPGKLNQVFMNLFVNAIQAIKEKGQIIIKTKIIQRLDVEYIEIQITDTGYGMTKEVKARIFEPFFTNKDVGVGTGLGLYISYGIIEKHKGQIEFDSEEGKGTTFKIYLPVHSPLRDETSDTNNKR